MEVLKHCSNTKTRKEVFIRHQNICAANVPIFEETVRLRNEASRFLGYGNFAAMRLESQMAKSPEIVDGFLEDLTARLKPKATLELEKLEVMKREERKASEDQGFYLWDFDYYHQRILEKEFNVDSTKVSEYFPATTAIRGLLDIFQDLFGLVIQEISASELARRSKTDAVSELLWQEDVRLFSVRDDEEEGGNFVGYLYIDMYSRDGKSSQAWNFSISPVSPRFSEIF
jgi:metallopeptidase MepB